MTDESQSRRSPLTGTMFIEFVDAADPDDPSAPPNFGTFQSRCEPELWRDDPRLPLLLRWLADNIEEEQRESRTDRGGD